MDNLRKFETEAEYSAATLVYPSVAWVVSGDTIHFDKTAPVVTNDKILMAFSANTDGQTISLLHLDSEEPTLYFNKIELNDVDVTSLVQISGILPDYTVANTNYVAKYDVKDAYYDSIFDKFAGNLGVNGGTVELYIPSQITEVDNIPSNTTNLVIEATTPPTLSINVSEFTVQGVYVPDEAVNAYKSASGWNDFEVLFSNIYPISQYSGNLPIN